MAGRSVAARRRACGCGSAWPCVVILLDQVTKTLILGSFQLGDSRTVTAFFNLVRVHNSGAAFSFLAGASGWQRWFFVGLGMVASGFIVWMLKKHPAQKLFCFAVTHDHGRRHRQRHRPAAARLRGRLHPGALRRLATSRSFNLADSAITLGAVCLILDEMLRVRRGAGRRLLGCTHDRDRQPRQRRRHRPKRHRAWCCAA